MLIAFRDILQKTARSLGIEPAMHLVQAREAWPEILGPALAGASEPRALRGGVLMVTATHALAAQEVNLRKEEILRELRRRIPQADLRQVRVMIRTPGGGGE